MPKHETGKCCFVIAPIGEEKTEIRRRSDQVLKHIIAPAAKDCGYEPIRADKIAEPGIITSQVIQHILEDPLVIADLTGRNPNVFYELAVRHAVRKPCVQVIQVGETIPFDVAGSRTIPVDHHDLDSASQCRDELIKQIHAVEKDPTLVDTPISVAVDLQVLRKSDDPIAKTSSDIIGMLQELRSMIGNLNESSMVRNRVPPPLFMDFMMAFDRLSSCLSVAEEEKPGRERFMEAQHSLMRLEKMLHMLMIESGMPPRMMEEFAERRVIRRKKAE
jgi:hypothetical protein